jgi:hypothetical protein
VGVRRHGAPPGQADPGAIVWDEVVAFWIVLWLVMPAGWLAQLVAFGLFRFFDAAKPGPVGWADRRFKPERGWRRAWASCRRSGGRAVHAAGDRAVALRDAMTQPASPLPDRPGLLDAVQAAALVSELADALRARGWCIASAESCTGGLIAAACTAWPARATGSSAASSPTATRPRPSCWA